MKKILTVLLVSLLFLLPPSVMAQKFASSDSNHLTANEIVEGDYFATGDTVTISGTVNGDVYAAGATIIIDGTVNGDVLAGGGNVTISGKVSDDVRVGAGNVTISGQIGKNLTLGTGNGTIGSTAKIGGSVVGGAGNLVILSPVGKNAVIGGGTVVLGNVIKGNVKASTGSLTLNQDARIGGNLDYSADKDATFTPGASVSGNTTKEINPQRHSEITRPAGMITAATAAWTIFTLIYSFIIGSLLLKFFPVFSRKTAERAFSLKSLGFGFLALILIPLVVILLLFTLVGIPIALLLVVGYIFYLLTAGIFASYGVGIKAMEYIDNKKENKYLLLLLGLVIYKAVSLIPFIGWIAGFLLTLCGMGAVILQKKATYSLLRSKNEI